MQFADPSSLPLAGGPPHGDLCQLALTKDLKRVATGAASSSEESRTIRIRLADIDEEVAAGSNRLIRRRYSDVGIAPNASLVEATPRRHVMSLAAVTDNEVIGTMAVRVRVDASTPLKCEQSYGDVVAVELQAGERLAEITGFSLDDANRLSFPLLAALIHSAVIFATNFGTTKFLAEVHPHHVPFYQRFVGMRLLGEERICQRAQRPAVLLGVSHDYILSQAARHAGHPASNCREIYKCFFPQEAAQAIRSRMFTKDH